MVLLLAGTVLATLIDTVNFWALHRWLSCKLIEEYAESHRLDTYYNSCIWLQARVLVMFCTARSEGGHVRFLGKAKSRLQKLVVRHTAYAHSLLQLERLETLLHAPQNS